MFQKKFSLILLIRKHRALGYIFSPFIGSVSSDMMSASIHSTVTLSDLDEVDLADHEKQIVGICDRYSDGYLVHHFSKSNRKKTTAGFFEEFGKEQFDKIIKPFIDNRLNEVFELAVKFRVPVFLKEGKEVETQNTKPVQLFTEPLLPEFSFIRTAEGIRYRLRVIHQGHELKLDEDRFSFISNDPVLLFTGDQVLAVKHLNSKIMKPFFRKDEVFIPKKFEKKYLEGFVRKAVRYHKVSLEGMDLIHKHEISPKRKLSLTKDLYGFPSLCLSFEYQGVAVFKNDPSKSIVRLSRKGEEISYVKMDRSFTEEKQACHFLSDTGLQNYQENYYTLKPQQTTEQELIKWINNHQESLKNNGFEVKRSASSDDYYLGDVDLSVEVSESNRDWFDLNMQIYLDDISFPFAFLVPNIRKGDPIFVLEDGRKFIIPDEWFTRFSDITRFAQTEGSLLKLAKYHVGLLEDADKKDIEHGTTDELMNLYRHDFSESVTEPSGLSGKLREYQRTGLSWLTQLHKLGFGGCLADDMGLGKTIQTIALLLQTKADSENTVYEKAQPQLTLFDHPQSNTKPSLLIMPTSLLFNWSNEIERFAPGLRILLYTGQRAELPQHFHKYDVILTSYGVMRIDVDILKKFSFHYLVLDESQFIKNPHSKTYSALLDLNAEHRLALTGTPVENSLSDLWSQLHFLNRGLLGSYGFFQDRFVIPIERDKNEDREERLKQLIHPFIMRRRKEEVVKELPDLTEQVYWCEMTEEQDEAYERYKSGIRNSLLDVFEEGVAKNEMRILEALLRMRQMSNHPRLAEPDFEGESGKFNEVIRSVENLVSEGHKALLFSSFAGYLKLFAEYFDEQNTPYAMITGKTKNREEQVNKFQHDEHTRLFLISLKAGGTGLNLTAADYVFILDPWWNPAAENQALSRAHRIGQKNKVFVYRFITRKSIEEKIYGLQKRKQQLADTFVNFNNPLKQLSEEELRQLFDFKA